MKYALTAPPTTEVHSENIIYLFVRDANGAGIAGAHIKVWAGPPPTGQPPYFVDDVPFRVTSASGRIEYTTFNGAMPDSRDYWMQVLDNSGAPLSDPIQFHFFKGGAIWATAILQSTDAPTPGGASADIKLDWDARLDQQLVTCDLATVANGQAYWKLIGAHFLPEGNAADQAQGRVNIYYTVLNENGQPIVGQRVWFAWPGDRASKLTEEGGTTNFNMTTDSTSDPTAGRPGPHSGYVDGLPSDTVKGMGLPLHRHVCYELTWRKTIRGAAPVANSSIVGTIANAPSGTQVTLTTGATTKTATLDDTGAYAFAQLAAGTYSISLPSVGVVKDNIALDGTNSARVDYTYKKQSLEDTVFARAKQFTWMPINDGAALYRFALDHNLGYPQTDEFDLQFGNDSYLAQVYNLGIVYVKKGDWGNIQWMKKR
jgi:hypothetical protein